MRNITKTIHRYISYLNQTFIDLNHIEPHYTVIATSLKLKKIFWDIFENLLTYKLNYYFLPSCMTL